MLGQSGSGSNGNEGVLHIPQSSTINEASLSDCLVLYPGNSLGESYPSVELQSVYSAAPVEWATKMFKSINLLTFTHLKKKEYSLVK